MRTQTTNRRGGLLLAGVASIALMGGSAFTNATTTTDVDGAVVGYGETEVSGATVTSLKYELSTDGSDITSATLELDGDTTTMKLTFGFSDGTTDNFTPVSCGAGATSGTDPDVVTTYVCDDGGTLAHVTANLKKTVIAVNSAPTA